MRVKTVSDITPAVLNQFTNGQLLFGFEGGFFLGEIRGNVMLLPNLVMKGKLNWLREAKELSVPQTCPPDKLMAFIAEQTKWGPATTDQDTFRIVLDKVNTQILCINGCLMFFHRTADMAVALFPPGYLPIPDS